MAKKAQATPKKSASTAAKKSVKASASSPPKAVKEAKPVAKPSVKMASAPKKATPPPVEAPKKVEAKPKAEKAPKSVQAAETSEKIKVDKSMTEEQARWVEMYNKYRDAQTSPYDMKSTFKAGSPIQHKILGWGWIVSNENDRLEVLFKDGKRMLISNYRS